MAFKYRIKCVNCGKIVSDSGSPIWIVKRIIPTYDETHTVINSPACCEVCAVAANEANIQAVTARYERAMRVIRGQSFEKTSLGQLYGEDETEN